MGAGGPGADDTGVKPCQDVLPTVAVKHTKTRLRKAKPLLPVLDLPEPRIPEHDYFGNRTAWIERVSG
jgi:hypothetical protein